MASKLVIISLLTTLLVLFHVGAAFRAAIVTGTDGNAEYGRGRGGGYESEECRRQAESRDLSPCMRFLEEQERKPYYSGGGDVSLAGRGSKAFYECCRELESVRDYRCRCDGLRVAVERLRGPRELRSLAGPAEALPRMCGVGPETCRFSSSW